MHFVIIDGNAIIHRAYHALPPLRNKEGILVNAVYGFTSILLKTLKDLRPDYLAVTFDLPGKTFRHVEYSEYKAHREKKPQDFYDQIPMIKELVNIFDISIFEKEGFEADDVIGTLATMATNPINTTNYKLPAGGEARHGRQTTNSIDVVIVTGDMDALQLINDNIKVCALKQGLSDTVIYDEQAVIERYGLRPDQLIDYKALRGDPSDNIPGVAGVGEKTATELLKKYGTLEKIYSAIDDNPETSDISKRVLEKLKGSKKDAILSKHLATIVKDVKIDFDLESTKIKPINFPKAVEIFQKYEFKSLLNRLKDLNNNLKNKPEVDAVAVPAKNQGFLFSSASDTQKSTREQNYTLIDTDAKFNSFLDKLQKQDAFVFDTETDSLDPITTKLLGISFCWGKGTAFYINVLALPKSIALLKPIFANEKIIKIGHNLKFDIRVLRHAGINVRGANFDTMVASYLLNPNIRQHNLDKIAFEEFGYEMMPYKALFENIKIPNKTKPDIYDVPTEKLSWYSCEDADFTMRIYEKYLADIKLKKLSELFSSIDMPLVEILSKMEDYGVKVDKQVLKKLSDKNHKRLDELTKEIIKLAGIDFNINSTQQLKEVLFERLKISAKGITRGKTGLSTAASELEKIKEAHPIIPLITEYRELAKLISTYLDALPELINLKTNRIHTSFNQTVTATGRLSSSEPNLQNIPIKSEIGKLIRQSFIAEEGNILLAVDYSQIELRIVAALSGDKIMLESFKKGEDIHTRTAAEIWNVSLDKVTSDMRRNAKAINFGIMYGMGAHGLAGNTGLSRDEAQEFIDKYFAVYKTIHKYLASIKEMAYDKGYAETLFKRRRYFPELQTSHAGLKAAAEREAVNHPMQGTASDLMKLAMIKLYKIPQINDGTWKMTLQVHDELVFEIPEIDIKPAAEIIKKNMEDVYQLNVPLITEVKVGKNWGEMEKI